MNKIPFNVPPYVDGEEKYVESAIKSHTICGDNSFTFKCQELMEKKFNSPKIHLTTSGTTALEMACMLADIQPVTKWFFLHLPSVQLPMLLLYLVVFQCLLI